MDDGKADVAARFGRAVRVQREMIGLSQEVLADRAGLHRTYISLIERGQRSASINVIEKLSGALGVSMSDLVAGAERK